MGNSAVISNEQTDTLSIVQSVVMTCGRDTNHLMIMKLIEGAHSDGNTG